LHSLERRSFSFPILEILGCEEQITFGSLLQQLDISKKGLFLTLKDLEIDGIIERRKKGGCTFVMLTPEGKIALIHYSNMNKNTGSITDQIVNETIYLLEQEGKISVDWSSGSRQEFINKIKFSITE
jgi:DNA-binding HxlR family transcriptional regulator